MAPAVSIDLSVSGNRHVGASALPHFVASTLPDQSPRLALRRGGALDALLELTLLHQVSVY